MTFTIGRDGSPSRLDFGGAMLRRVDRQRPARSADKGTLVAARLSAPRAYILRSCRPIGDVDISSRLSAA